ncbi:hypothetical protein BT69DRAFT_1279212 [Atractiella rhizophila]|nr:hypothetical protein BT69DRAFT_1279212 [Atractiella rhizophila]
METTLKSNLRAAMKRTDAEHPTYGKATGLNPELWWSMVIKRTFVSSGVAEADFDSVSGDLTRSLIHRFASREGYSLFPDVLPCIQALRASSPPISIGVVSQTDMAPQILDSFGFLWTPNTSGRAEDRVAVDDDDEALGAAKGCIDGRNVITSWEIGSGKRTEEIWEAAFRRVNDVREGAGLEKLRRDEILAIGDDLELDFLAPRRFGFQALHLDRSPAFGTPDAGGAGSVTSPPSTNSVPSVHSVPHLWNLVKLLSRL